MDTRILSVGSEILRVNTRIDARMSNMKIRVDNTNTRVDSVDTRMYAFKKAQDQIVNELNREPVFDGRA